MTGVCQLDDCDILIYKRSFNNTQIIIDNLTQAIRLFEAQYILKVDICFKIIKNNLLHPLV